MLGFSRARYYQSVTLPASFPELSRAFSLKQKEDPIDPTIRDSYENGMESARARFTRLRRTFSCSLDFLTADDKAVLDQFYQRTVVYGSLAFTLSDPRNAENPQTYIVRFAKLPSYTDAGWVDDQYRYNATFEVREV